MNEKSTDALTEAVRALIEADAQLARDLDCSSREWCLSRVRRAMMTLMRLFPKESLVALSRATAPDGTELWAE